MVAVFAFAVSFSIAERTFAQRFRDLTEQSREISLEALSSAAEPLLRSCEQLSGAKKNKCIVHRNRDIRELKRGLLLVSVPARNRIRIGGFERGHEGFRIRVVGLLVGDDQHGFVATAPTEAGELPLHEVAKGFVHVRPDAAAQWMARNDVERLRLRLVIRFSDAFTDHGHRGALVDVVGAQVYNESSGEVLVDTVHRADVPAELKVLDRPVVLWEQAGGQEIGWLTSDRRELIFSFKVTPTSDEGKDVSVIVTNGATEQEMSKLHLSHRSANVSLVPRRTDQVMMIVTVQKKSDESAGRGEVHLFEWSKKTGMMDLVAVWRGTSEETPPAWVTNPTAPTQ